MRHQLLRFGPALVMLLAALVYAGAIFWENQGAPVMPPIQAAKPGPVALRPAPEVCAALPHYIPTLALPVRGKIMAVEQGVLAIKTEEGIKQVKLVPTTQIRALGERKKPTARGAELSAFMAQATACNDGNLVYVAPEIYEEKAATAQALKPGLGVEVLLDGSDVTQAAWVTVRKK